VAVRISSHPYSFRWKVTASYSLLNGRGAHSEVNDASLVGVRCSDYLVKRTPTSRGTARLRSYGSSNKRSSGRNSRRI